ncbi:ion transporter [Sphingobacterium griseoflavum]|uniref:Ion transporter n=1 Tax=Sphingobacterium griseoflavum TaxID=1474952 RepID=A0ABQ3HXX4_9SPHI|nr:ion transporter [Sphingobacterium griseoflavum]GHE33983.1 ion transporter [Sphingobacterium griseoflavum]
MMKKKKSDVFKRKLYRIIFRSDTPLGKYFDIALLVLIVVSIVSVFMESISEIRARYMPYIQVLEWGLTICFTIEYALRIYCVRKPMRYIKSFYGVIDLLSILPTYTSVIIAGTQYLVVIRALRLLRVFRVLKLTRYLSEGNILRTALRASFHKITVFLASVITLVTIVGTIMYVVEGEQNGFNNIPTSIYWAIVTITTVGYGDLSPQTSIGQLFASILMIIGYGIIAVPTGIVSVEMAKASENEKPRCRRCQDKIDKPNARFCANCGMLLQAKNQPDV